MAAIAGDMNTSFEAGLAGKAVEECALADFGCKEGPLPPTACAASDGYDDTLGGILEAGPVGGTKWRVLSRQLPRTYDDPVFADFAIDHIAVPAGKAGKFSNTQRGRRLSGLITSRSGPSGGVEQKSPSNAGHQHGLVGQATLLHSRGGSSGAAADLEGI